MNHSLRWGLMLMLVLVLSLSACTRAQDDVLAENPEGQATEESSGGLFGAPEDEGDAAAEAAAVEAPAAEGEAPAAEGEAPAAEGEAPAAEGEAPAAEGEAPAAEGEAPADAAAEAGTVETTTEGETAPEPQATTIAIDAVAPEEGGDDTTAEASGDVYAVAEGDTLLSIAEKNGTTVDELRALNNLTSNFIYVGQQLKVPSQVVQTSDTSGDAVVETTAEGSGESTTEGSGEGTAEGSGEGTAEGSGEGTAEGSGETTTKAPAESASTTTTDGNGNIIHVVTKNEWIYDIARGYEGVSPQDILNANPHLTNPDIVIPGQELIIPVK